MAKKEKKELDRTALAAKLAQAANMLLRLSVPAGQAKAILYPVQIINDVAKELNNEPIKK